jgi:hypothetical protein
MTFDLLPAGAPVAVTRRGRIRAPGIFALCGAGYSAFCVFEELPGVDPAHHIPRERYFWVARPLAGPAAAWLARIQLRASEVPSRQAERQGGARCQMP